MSKKLNMQRSNQLIRVEELAEYKLNIELHTHLKVSALHKGWRQLHLIIHDILLIARSISSEPQLIYALTNIAKEYTGDSDLKRLPGELLSRLDYIIQVYRDLDMDFLATNRDIAEDVKSLHEAMSTTARNATEGIALLRSKELQRIDGNERYDMPSAIVGGRRLGTVNLMRLWLAQELEKWRRKHSEYKSWQVAEAFYNYLLHISPDVRSDEQEYAYKQLGVYFDNEGHIIFNRRRALAQYMTDLRRTVK